MNRARLRFVGILLFALVAGVAAPAAAQSLWSDDWSLFTDLKARRVGDLVTLIIVERTEASQEARTTTSKDGEVSIGPGLGFLDIIPLIQASGGDSLSAGGTTTRGGSLQAKMTTRVVEVLPNGVLRIEGRQTIVLNGEEQEIVVSGLVRTRDIAADNTVLSTYVADAHITFKGTGVLGNEQRRGILTRLFDWLF